MTVSHSSPSANLRVFAKLAHASPSGTVAAVVKFYLRAEQRSESLPLHGRVPKGGPERTIQRTFQFDELQAFLEAGRARAAVAGMLSLLPLALEPSCFQAWAGFISSVLSVAAWRSQRRNLGGIMGIVRIDCLGTAEGAKLPGAGDEVCSVSPPSEDRSAIKPSEGTVAAQNTTENDGGYGGFSSCPICQESITGDGAEVAKTHCGHGFHGACLSRWLESHPTCPICRSEMPEKMPDRAS